MANDLDAGKVELDVGKVKVGGGDCNGIAVVDKIDGDAKENGHDPVLLQPDQAESLRDSQYQAVEKNNANLSEEIKHDVDCEVEKGEGGHDNDEIQEEIVESVAEGEETVEELPQVVEAEQEEKVEELLQVAAAEEENKVEDQESPQVVEAVDSNSHVIAAGAEEENRLEDQELPQVVDPNSHEIVNQENKLGDVNVESNSPEIVNDENQVEDQVTLDSKQNQELDSLTEANSVESELPQPLEREQGIIVDTSKSAASGDSLENQHAEPSIVEASESESQQLGRGEEIQESSTQVDQPVETETCKVGEPADNIIVDKPSSNSEAENVSTDDVHVQSEDTTGTEAIGARLDTVPVEQPSLESDVIDNSAEPQDQSSTDAIVDIGSQHPLVNGNAENTESSSSVVEMERELDVEGVSAENGEPFMAGTAVIPDVNVSVEGDESMSACPIDNLKPESVCGSGAIEGNQNKLEITDIADDNGGSTNALSIEQSAPENETTTASVAGQDRSSTDPVAQIGSESSDVTGNVEHTALFSSSSVEVKPETDVEVYAENGESLSASQVPCTDGEVSVKRDENWPASSVDDLNSESVLSNGFIEKNQSISANPDHDNQREKATDDIIGHSELPAETADSELESGVVNSSTNKSDSTEVSLLSNGAGVSDESDSDVKNGVTSSEIEEDRPFCGNSNGKSIEGDDIKVIDNDRNCPKDSSTNALEGTKVECDTENKPFRYLIKIPRYIDEKYESQIEHAQKQVDAKTQIRDELRLQIQSRRETSGEYRDRYEAARSEERASREALNAKRREMDSLLSVINRMKNATSVEDINDRVRSMEHRIEHETVPLKEEKQLIREIKQLKQHRDQLSSSLGQQAELEPTADERAKIEERFKLLKQEMESCKKEVVRLEGVTKVAWKIYSDENEKVKELQSQFRAADNLRQEAYMQLRNIKKQLYEKRQYFRTFNEDIMKAKGYASARDTEALHSHCTNQVGRVMELWNNNDEFRKEYIRCNKVSTLRRLRTLDGRALGPEEPAPVLHNVRDGTVDSSVVASANAMNFPSLSASEKGKPVGENAVNIEQKQKPKADSKIVVNLEQKFPTVKSKTTTKIPASENSRVTVSSKEDREQNAEENRRTREEELARKEEELRKKEEELRKKEEDAKLKEQRRLEEKAKAKEAEERKRRNAEKAQARAELRAQKEAELKEKERDKRARKKERKKKVDTATGGDEVESVSRAEHTQPEATPDPEVKEKPKTVVKRPLKPSLLAKQAKPKVIPPPLPLRNRGKKRMQQWEWILLMVVVIVALFLVGNIGFSFKFGLPSFHS